MPEQLCERLSVPLNGTHNDGAAAADDATARGSWNNSVGSTMPECIPRHGTQRRVAFLS
jgi:hypothetical protein